MLCFGLSTLRLKLPPTKPSLQFSRITKKKKKEKKVKRRKEHFGQIDSQHITLYVRESQTKILTTRKLIAKNNVAPKYI